MPRRPHPAAGDRLFPRSKGWSGKPWHEVIDVHISAHRRGGADTVMGFDDDDRLCVVQHGRGGYAVRVPASLVDWAEREMEREAVTPVPNHPQQLRFARGHGGSRYSEDALPDRDQIVTHVAREADVRPESLGPLFCGPIFNMEFGTGIPVKTEVLEGLGLAYGYVERDGSLWTVHYGVIERATDGGANIAGN